MGRLLEASALACLMTVLPLGLASAQTPEELAVRDRVAPDGQMLLEADTLVYDNDAQTVTAVGGVQIDYNNNRLVAQRVSYNRATGRLVASGAVQAVDPGGNIIYSDQIDVTDDFRDGFVSALRIETPDKTYFAAESAERRDGVVTTFNRGVYTACEPCEDQPSKPPIWRIKAQKIIWNGQTKVVRFESARFEMFGFPIAYLPAFEVADPTVRRKSGFLFPTFGYKNKLGFSAAVPYYFALSPTYDLTLTPRGYTRQGFMGEAEWRQKFDNGEYNLRVAGINQLKPEAFDENTVDRQEEFRGAVTTRGAFTINPRWTFGWDALLQTDKNFAYTYGLDDYGTYVHRSEIYLTGLNDRNYFDLRAMKFQVQESVLDDNPDSVAERQPYVLPSFDYSLTPDTPIAGGELNIDVNVTAISRDRLAIDDYPDFAGVVPPIYGQNIRGIDGDTARATAQAEWRRTLITPGGLALTPLLQVRGDGIFTDYEENTVQALQSQYVAADIRDEYWRGMATAGLEARWPVLFTSANSTHVIEPTAQILVRPNEQFAERLGIPNEDAQSLVFDATSLFETDKFSGYDRVEGGTRANLGIRYSGTFANGWTTNAIVGQSFHLGGQNSFASPDLVSAGAFSGLESDRSDYVAQVGVGSPLGFTGIVGARFDEDSLDLRRGEVKVGYNTVPLAVTAQYAFIEKQPLYGFPRDRHEITVGARAKVAEAWSVFGSAIYDFQSEVVVRDSIGFAYDDECFTFAMAFNEQREIDTREVSRGVGFQLTFRTIGDFGSVNRGGLN
ncbi:LPS-assembly protein LptD [Tianweitania sediminis]|uniref:LPS-assembly protein LptD n=1 Tax=Tianweitania sediminis TaxID=1502156 RepID=A0A8J7UL47_9HYPH|nr:LPS-assembly protein LptD [Tianweitania sediminis]MBP0439012.1 LPS-assembly protein LptD [Tianweitania sediminis]